MDDDRMADRHRDRSRGEVAERLLTTREAADTLGVGATTIKRWADAGVLRSVRTAGQHRRFSLGEVDRLRGLRDAPVEAPAPGASPGDPRVGAWLEGLVGELDDRGFTALLADERAKVGAWWRVAEAMGPVLVEMGERWRAGRLSIVDEHVASERLSRAISRICERLPAAPDAPLALLTLVPEDTHGLGLALAELCLAEAGWRVRRLGLLAPIDETRAYLEREPSDLVVLGASTFMAERDRLAEIASRFGALCDRHGIALVLGGGGAWPDPPPFGHRLRSYGAFADFLRRWSPPRSRA
ncbi:MAG: excisionase family DNA-binding protein [Myxococcales bacterium]|nr:excisionase family DNA-binding protein [Myxococcales bacterium]